MSDSDYLRISMGLEFNECSLAAAELSGRVAELSQNPRNFELEHLLVMEPGYVQDKVLDVAQLSPTFNTPSGRPVSLALAKDPTDPEAFPRLLVKAQGGVALPIAGFARREGTPCDFVQIGSEMYGDNLIVSSDDDVKRKDLIVDLMKILRVNPFEVKYGPALMEKVSQHRPVEFYKEIERYIKSADGLDIYSKEAYSKEALLMIAVAEFAESSDATGSYEYNGLDSKLKAVNITSRSLRYKLAQRKVANLAEEIPMSDLLAGTVPELENDQYFCDALAVAVGNRNGVTFARHNTYENERKLREATLQDFYTVQTVNPWDRDHYYGAQSRPSVRRLLSTHQYEDMDVDAILDQQLGPYDQEHASIVDHLARIAGRNWVSVDQFLIEDSGKTLTVDSRLEAIADGFDAHQVVFQYRPTHQPGMAYAELFREVIRRSEPSHLTDAKRAEVHLRITDNMSKNPPAPERITRPQPPVAVRPKFRLGRRK